ncbi:hypothetical protein HYALB_00000908 [Hymenoscyphus albidus]|uniref:Uncharacterized protein n=1 Tax=Hymenoscyphus albidus TaxID=595503 RepID=A0A9N9LB57_9HELO|nr:hypothetical protein HYALB_00000908 [Hymenoscyphus albidus]
MYVLTTQPVTDRNTSFNMANEWKSSSTHKPKEQQKKTSIKKRNPFDTIPEIPLPDSPKTSIASTNTLQNENPFNAPPGDNEPTAAVPHIIAPPPMTSICTDWCIVDGDTHYARDLAWFKTYTPLIETAAGLIIQGIGTVELEVRTSRQDPSATRTIIMRDVLHIPDAVCNAFQPAFYEGCVLHADDEGLNFLVGRDREGNVCFLAEGGKRLMLKGNGVVGLEGRGFLGIDEMGGLGVHLSREERDLLFPPRRAVSYI